MDNQNENKIEELQSDLYSRNADGIFLKKRHVLKDNGLYSNRPTEWQEEPEAPKKNIPYNKILLVTFIFFVLALGFAFFRFFGGSNTVSGNNIDILVSGPVSIGGGEELPLDILVKNNNNINLQTVDLRIEFPAGTRQPGNIQTELKRYSEVLGNISIGKSAERVVKAVLFGQENTQQVIKVIVEYRVAGSNAIFSKEKDYNILLSSSPVNISVLGPTEVNSNQPVNFTVNITSNSVTTVKNLILKIDYPFGFNLDNSTPKAVSSDGSVFNLGDLEPGAKRVIKISGVAQGQNGEQRVFKFTVGAESTAKENIIDVPLSVYTSTLSLKKPSLGVSITLDQYSDQVVSAYGDKKIIGQISWQNNLTDKIENASIIVQLKGNILNKDSVSVERGFYNSIDNSITFDKNDYSDLATINPGSVGNMSFSFSLYSPNSKPNISFSNSELDITIKAVGDIAESGGKIQGTLFSDTRIVKELSDLKILSRSLHNIGAFENSGSVPPQVENETTYTIVWTATDSFNSISGAKVTAILPPYVKWTGYTLPSTEKINYDANSGQVVWDIGNMQPGLGTNSPAREVSFQVSITPSLSQIGKDLNLINETTISGIDAFSGQRVGEVKPPTTTNIVSDPTYTKDIGKVTR
jgi:hypothetical protein